MAENTTKKYISNISSKGNAGKTKNLVAGGNTPAEYASRQHQYYGGKTRLFASENAKYASDYVAAKVQGISPTDFYKYYSTKIRLSDVHATGATSSADGQQRDDQKLVLFPEKKIDYFPIGAKIETMGSTWICTNPSNLSSVHTTAYVQRCNASYNLYDYYGKIITEPIIVEKSSMLASDNANGGQNLVLMDGYYNVICQYNDNTKILDQNQRIILGSKAYHITGFTDFIQEFTGNYDSCHILRFAIRVEEPTIDDDIPNKIANGKNMTFAIAIEGNPKIEVGKRRALRAAFIKNGEEVYGTDEYPVSFEWKSSDESIVTVDESGTIEAIGVGTAQITAKLSQNKKIKAVLDIIVEEEQVAPYIEVLNAVPQSVEQFDHVNIVAAYFADGEQTEETISWEFSGAHPDNYTATVNEANNEAIIDCYGADGKPLKVKMSYTDAYGETATKEIEIRLEGF